MFSASYTLLDEVNAPLDDANVGRFCALVQAMSARVSRSVVVDVDEAVEMVGV